MILNAQQIRKKLPEFVSHEQKGQYRDAARTLLEQPEKLINLSPLEIDYLAWIRDWLGAITKQQAKRFEKICEKIERKKL